VGRKRTITNIAQSSRTSRDGISLDMGGMNLASDSLDDEFEKY
jgi:hypothetical protein